MAMWKSCIFSLNFIFLFLARFRFYYHVYFYFCLSHHFTVAWLAAQALAGNEKSVSSCNNKKKCATVKANVRKLKDSGHDQYTPRQGKGKEKQEDRCQWLIHTHFT